MGKLYKGQQRALHFKKSEWRALAFTASLPSGALDVVACKAVLGCKFQFVSRNFGIDGFGPHLQESDFKFFFSVCNAVMDQSYLGRDGPLGRDGRAKLLSFSLHALIDSGYSQVEGARYSKSRGEISAYKARSVEDAYHRTVRILASHFDWVSSGHLCGSVPPEQCWIYEASPEEMRYVR